MNIQKITTYVSALLGLLGLIFLILIISKGDDSIEMDAMQGDYGSVSSIILLAQVILALAVAITLFFSLKNLFSDKANLKKSIMTIAAFLSVFLIAFLLSSGEETPTKDGEFISAFEAKLVETGTVSYTHLTLPTKA